jgi:glycosyltransferase involved in cell wall biosynthesis
MQDSLCRLEAKLFKNIIVVSEELRLKGRFTKASIVGLGGSHIATDSSLEGDSKSLNILYVGAITGRDLGVAIKSIGLLGPEKVELRIAGVGSDKDMDELRSLIRLLKIEGKVELLGYLQSSNLVEHYSWANVGLVHVPPRSYYQCQPSTKLYEYMGAGLHLLVSRYGFYDNKLNQSFATLYDFNESSLAESIVRLWLEIPFKQSKQDISVYVEDHSWDVIVKNQLIPVLDSIGN